MTQKYLKEIINYNIETGIFTWKIKKGRGLPGKEVGWIDDKGYKICEINGKPFRLHRLAFLYVNGSFPERHLDVDHINQITNDNRWANLRIVTRSENRFNTVKNNGGIWPKGVTFHAASGKFQAQTCLNYKKIHLGLFFTPEEAHKKYLDFVNKNIKYKGETK